MVWAGPASRPSTTSSSRLRPSRGSTFAGGRSSGRNLQWSVMEIFYISQVIFRELHCKCAPNVAKPYVMKHCQCKKVWQVFKTELVMIFIAISACLIKYLAAVFFTSVCLDKVYSTEPVYMFHLLCSSGRVRSTDHKCTVCDVDPNPDPHGFAFSENSKVRNFSQKMLIFTKKK